MAKAGGKPLPKAFWALIGLCIVMVLALIVGILMENLRARPKSPPAPLPSTGAEVGAKEISCKVIGSGFVAIGANQVFVTPVAADTGSVTNQLWVTGGPGLAVQRLRIYEAGQGRWEGAFADNIDLVCAKGIAGGCIDPANFTGPLRAETFDAGDGEVAVRIWNKDQVLATAPLNKKNKKFPLAAGLGLCGKPAPAGSVAFVGEAMNRHLIAVWPAAGLAGAYVAKNESVFFDRAIPESPVKAVRFARPVNEPATCRDLTAKQSVTASDVYQNKLLALTKDLAAADSSLALYDLSQTPALSLPAWSLSSRELYGSARWAGLLGNDFVATLTSNWLGSNQAFYVYKIGTQEAAAYLTGLSGASVHLPLTRPKKPRDDQPVALLQEKGFGWMSRTKGSFVRLVNGEFSTIEIAKFTAGDTIGTWLPLSGTSYLYLSRKDASAPLAFQKIECRFN